MRCLHPASFILHPFMLIMGLALGVAVVPTPAQSVSFTLLPLLLSQAAPPSKQENPVPPSPEQLEFNRLMQEGGEAYNRADYAAALKAFQVGLEKAQALHNQHDTAGILRNIAIVYFATSEFDMALDYCNRALTLEEQLGDPKEIARTLTTMGNIYANRGQLNKALETQNRALAIKETLGNPLDIGMSLLNIGNTYFEGGQFAKAAEYHLRALPLFERANQPGYVAASLNNLGNAYRNLGEFDKALDYHTRALALREKLEQPRLVTDSLSNIGNVYFNLGQLDKAADYYKRALVLDERRGFPLDLARSLTNMGNIYYELGRYDQVIDYCNRALPMKEKIGNPREIAQTLNNLGNAHFKLGHFDKAEELYNRVLALAEKHGDQLDVAYSLINLGGLYDSRKQFDRALDAYYRALPIVESPQTTTTILIHIGITQAKRKHYEEAARAYESALAKSEGIEAQVGEASQISAFQQATQGEVYTSYAALLLLRKRFADALAMVERRRGHGLAKQAAQSHTRLDRYLTVAEVEERQRHLDDFTAADFLLRSLRNRRVPADPAAQQALTQQMLKALASYNEVLRRMTLLEDSLRARHPQYGRLQGIKPPDVKELLALSATHPDTLYLEYFVMDVRSVVLFTLRQGHLKVILLPVSTLALIQMTQEWQAALLRQSHSEPKLARQLYNAVFSPLEQQNKKKKEVDPPFSSRPFAASRLVIIAEGPLQNIPFAALLDSKGRRLIERIAISMSFSLGILTWPKAQPQPTASLLCVADSQGAGGEKVESVARGGRFGALPFARKEGQAVHKLYPGSTLLTGKFGSESAVKASMGKYNLLHFAVHGSLDGNMGMRSALVLTKEDEEKTEDGFLEAREIAEMQLSARLAVLSACDTAQGQKAGGEGLLGLAWAFRAAGVPAIVASQWKVEDEATSRLMVAFYKGLKAGKRKDEALQAAMLLVKKAKPQPYYWAAFQVIGDTSRLSGLAQKGSKTP